MHRSRALAFSAVGAAMAATVVMALPSSAVSGDRTGAYGPLGMTTLGLGATSSYGEPSIAAAPDGRHVVISTPGGSGVHLWYSADNGRTWKTNYTTSNGGGGDSDVDFLPDGTLLSADLTVANSNVKISKNFGQTWDGGRAAGTEQDRQWLAHTPDGQRLFLVYHDFAAEAEFISESDDAGKTWTTLPSNQIVVNSPDQATGTPSIVPGSNGGSASILDQGVNTFSGPMLIAPNNRDFYVVYAISDNQSNLEPTDGVPPFGPVRSIVVAHSADAGKTWTNRYAVEAPGNADAAKEQSNGTLFPWGFIDPAGTIYVIFGSTRGVEGTDHYHYYYTYSTDKGVRWSTPTKIDGLPMTRGGTVFNAGAAVRPGVIDVAWLQSDTSTPSGTKGSWYPWIAQISRANTAHPKIVKQRITTIPNHTGGVCIQGILCGVAPGSSDRSLLDFFQLTVNPRTHLAEVAYADNAGQRPDGTRGEVVYAQQTRVPAVAGRGVGPGLPKAPVSPALPVAVATMGLLYVLSRRLPTFSRAAVATA